MAIIETVVTMEAIGKHGYDGYDEPNRVWYHLDHLYKVKHGLYTPPVMVEVSPTSKCNHECRFCYTYEREDVNMLDGKVLIDFFSNASNMGINTLFIQGTGEPTLNKSLADAIAAGGKTDEKMSLTTNGVAFDKMKQEKSLDSLVFTKFSVIDNDPKRYAETHVCSESQFHKLVKNIEHATNYRSKNNLDVSLWGSIYVDDDNFYDVYDIAKFSKSIGLEFISISSAFYTEYTPNGPKVLVSDKVSAEEVDEMKERVMSLQDNQFKIRMQFPIFKHLGDKRWDKDYCQAIKLISAVSGDGEVYPCWRFWGKKEYSYGSLYEQSFEEIWRGEKRKKVNEYLFNTPPKGDACEVCKCVTANKNIDKLLNNTNKWKDIL